MKFKMNLHLFEGDGGAGAAPAAGGDGGEAAVTPGVLEDGTQVDDRLAARIKELNQKRKARGEAPMQIPHKAKQPAAQPQAGQPQAAQPQAPQQEPSLEDQWNEAKNGKYKDLYGRDVKAAIQDRFKNQDDAKAQLDKLGPMLNLLMEREGVKSVDDLVTHIMDDDSLYEEEAERRGMTVEGVKNLRALEEENARLKEKEQQDAERMFIEQHLQKLAMQAEELKKIYPNFDLRTELQNDTFRRLTAPNSGLDVKTAFYAVHHDELEPQAISYGIQKAQQQMSQSMQANSRRPVEGAALRGQPAEHAIDPRNLTRQEREALIERAKRGEVITF